MDLLSDHFFFFVTVAVVVPLRCFDRQGLGAVNENVNIQIEPSIIRMVDRKKNLKRKIVILVRFLCIIYMIFQWLPPWQNPSKAFKLCYCAWVREDSLWFCEQQNYGFFSRSHVFDKRKRNIYIYQAQQLWQQLYAHTHTQQAAATAIASCRVGWQKRFIWLIQRHLA